MSFDKRDHPPETATCRYCREKFKTLGRAVDICAPCFAELNDEYPENEEEEDDEP